jgi:RNA polymerase sigma-70 factor (ECF subfamily)
MGPDSDADGFGPWYEAEHARLLAAMTLASGSVDVARDVTAEAFARALERWARVCRMDSPGGWTYRVALNVLRRQQRRERLERHALRRAGTIAHPAAPAGRDIEIWDAVRTLPERSRTAVALRYLGGLTEAEVAEAMGIAVGTVSATLSVARRRLAVSLADEPDPVKADSIEGGAACAS